MSKILIADDKQSSRELIRSLLEHSGYTVIEAGDGREAVAAALREKPDLLLIDLQMPILDGFGVLSALRQDEELSTRPIVALTAYAMQGDREKALAAGFTEYLTKPINLSALRREVAKLLLQG